MLSHNQSLKSYLLPQLNKNVQLSSLFTNCYAITEFMVCRDFKFSSQGYLPFNKVPKYLSLPNNLTGYMVITDLYRNNDSVSFLENNKFLYSNIQVARYEKTLKTSSIFNKLNFNHVFSQKYANKAGFIGIQNKKLIFLDHIPYNISGNYLLYKDLQLEKIIFRDDQTRKLLQKLQASYSQVVNIAKGYIQKTDIQLNRIRPK